MTTTAYTKQISTERTRHCQYTIAEHSTRDTSTLPLCSIIEINDTTVSIGSHSVPPPIKHAPHYFHEVLLSWSHPEFWKELKNTGNGSWLYQAIHDHSLICVSHGSYIRQLHPEVCSAAIIFEYKQGRGHLSLSFAEKSPYTNAFRGELLGLMAVHLLLCSIDKTNPNLTCSVEVYSDCNGTLRTVDSLPKSTLLPNWTHLDILKIILYTAKVFPLPGNFFM